MSKDIVLVILGAIILCFIGLNNKFPVLTSDTGAYINSAFIKKVPFDRPLLYGLFVAHTSWWKSLWLVIFSQALTLSLILYYYFRYFSKQIHSIVFYLSCVFYITFFTLASLTVSTIGTDIFASISILSVGLLLFAGDLNKRDFSIIITAIIISSGMDISYLVTLSLLISIYCIKLLLKKNKELIQINLKRAAISIVLIFTSALLVASIHFSSGSGFKIMRNYKIAILPRLLIEGNAKSYLDSQCKEDSSLLCLNKDNLKNIISPRGRFRNPALTIEEEHALQNTTLTLSLQQGFWKKFAIQSMNTFIHQLISIEADRVIDIKGSKETINSIFKWYNEDVRECSISRQTQGWLKLKLFNYCQILSFIVCVIIYVFIFLGKIKSRYRSLFIYLFLAYLIHLFVNSILYGNNDSQIQVSWMLTIPIFLHFSDSEFMNRKLNIYNANRNSNNQKTLKSQTNN